MKFKKASIFTTLVIAVLMLYAVISLVMVHRQTRQLQDRAATEMTQSNAELQYQIDHSEDDDMIESVAREKLGLVKPGEKIFYDTSD